MEQSIKGFHNGTDTDGPHETDPLTGQDPGNIEDMAGEPGQQVDSAQNEPEEDIADTPAQPGNEDEDEGDHGEDDEEDHGEDDDEGDHGEDPDHIVPPGEGYLLVLCSWHSPGLVDLLSLSLSIIGWQTQNSIMRGTTSHSNTITL